MEGWICPEHCLQSLGVVGNQQKRVFSPEDVDNAEEESCQGTGIFITSFLHFECVICLLFFFRLILREFSAFGLNSSRNIRFKGKKTFNKNIFPMLCFPCCLAAFTQDMAFEQEHITNHHRVTNALKKMRERKKENDFVHKTCTDR